MAISRQEINALAKLSKLEFSEERAAELCGEMEEIIRFADKINEMVEGNTEVIRQVGGREISYFDLRDDEVTESLPQEKVLSNVQSENGYFPVKRVVK